MPLIFGNVEIPNSSSTDVPTYFDVPQPTTKNADRVDEASTEFEAETARQASLRDVLMVSSIGAKDDVISRTDAQTKSFLIAETPSTDGSTYGVTEMQTSPRPSLA
ncbi:hypothetical protein H5410_027771 [Solanum commersonii]|uniref:Uncharacterized protein n=1 Tax=Solanum commersonii TaxID=4109 RepID=A0A9J5Z311_SOLCO|nr:hypothetical protein H5410_027771 [Solanum commersonii]